MESKNKKWFSALASNDLDTIDQMLEDGFEANTVNDEGRSGLQEIAKKLSLAIVALDWDKEKLLKEIAATLVIHGAKQEDLGHRGGEACDIVRAITIHIIKTATIKGKLSAINKLIDDSQLWFPEEISDAKEKFLSLVGKKDLVSIEKMFEYELIGFPPTQ